MRHRLMLEAAARGKYAQLFRRLSTLEVSRWQTTFGDVESIPGFTLPDSARIHTRCGEVPVSGRQVHDANIVATMLAHGERGLVTFNAKDFQRHGERIELAGMDHRR